jgi:hypothetical protein
MNDKSQEIAAVLSKPMLALPAYAATFSVAHWSIDDWTKAAGLIGLMLLAATNGVNLYRNLLAAKKERAELKKGAGQ